MAGYDQNIIEDITYIKTTFMNNFLFITHWDSLSFSDQLNINKKKINKQKYNMNVNKQTNKNNYGWI